MAFHCDDGERHILFEKSYSLDSFEIPRLIDLDTLKTHFLTGPVWEFAEGSQLRHDLDVTRAYLNDKNLHEWGEHTSRTDLSSFVMPKIRQLFPNLSQTCLFTRAWCKLIEILYSFPVIDLNSDPIINYGFNGLFLCEAPGSFIHAAHHYVNSEKPGTPFFWRASSLNVYYEESDVLKTTICDDRFINCSITYENWFFGDDDRGDLLDANTMIELCNKYKKHPAADLVTGDGGISCVDEPGRQEENSFPLVFHQFLTSINCLKAGGSLVLKMFNLFTSQSLSLVYLAYCLFEQVHFYKPVLSKAGNSEIYLVCCKMFRSRAVIETITSLYIEKFQACSETLSYSAVLDQSLIPAAYKRQFIQCATFFMNSQKSAIIHNLLMFDNPNRDSVYNSLINAKKAVARIYCAKKFLLRPNFYSITNGHNYGFLRFNPFAYNQECLANLTLSNASYLVRMAATGTKINSIGHVLQHLYVHHEVENFICPWRPITDTLTLPALKMKFGKPFTKITNSKFVDNNLLHLHNAFNSILAQKPCKIHGSSTFSSEPTHFADSRFVSCLLSCLEANSVAFTQMYGRQTSALLKHLYGVLLNMPSRTKIVFENFRITRGSIPMKERSIIFIDPYDYSGSTPCDENCCGAFVPIVEEPDLILNIVDQLLEFLPCVKPFDVLVIHSCSVLSRLMVQLIFMLTTIFGKVSVVPNCIARRVVQVQSESKSLITQACQLGMLIVLTSVTKDFEEFENQKRIILIYLKEIRNAIVSSRKMGGMLLELFPIVRIFTNRVFCEILFTGNFTHFVERMKKLIDEEVFPFGSIVI